MKQRRVVFPKNSVWVSSSILNFLSVTQWFKNDVEIFSFFNLQFSKCDSVFFILQLTYADISFFNFLNSWVAKDKIKGYPAELENFPLLRGLYERVRDIPAVKKRLETRPDTVL